MLVFEEVVWGEGDTGIREQYICGEYDFWNIAMERAMTKNGVVERTI